MKIKLHNGKREVILSGEDGQFTLEEKWTSINKDTGEKKEQSRVSGYYSSLEGALSALLRLKISNSDASTLAELQAELKRLRDELIFTYETDIQKSKQ